MPKLYSAKTIITTLNKAGFTAISQRGSHIKLIKTSSTRTLTVIVPNHKEVALGTFQNILKQASLTRNQFEEFVK